MIVKSRSAGLPNEAHFEELSYGMAEGIPTGVEIYDQLAKGPLTFNEIYLRLHFRLLDSYRSVDRIPQVRHAKAC